MFREMPEIRVAGNERYIMIDTGLCDHGVGKAGAELAGDEAGAHFAHANPETVAEFEAGEALYQIGERCWQFRI